MELIVNMNSTVNYYDNNASRYFDETINADMKLSYDKFLIRIPNEGYILDFGCGSGRDSKYFLEQGYKVKAVDGSLELCRLAEKYINHKVEHMCFSDLDEKEVYDGIWACSSILHMSLEEFILVYKKMIDALKLDGIMYISFKDGVGEEIINGRYFKYYTKEDFVELTNGFNNLEILEIYDNISSTNMNEKRYWNNIILKKVKK